MLKKIKMEKENKNQLLLQQNRLGSGELLCLVVKTLTWATICFPMASPGDIPRCLRWKLGSRTKPRSLFFSVYCHSNLIDFHILIKAISLAGIKW